MKSKKSKLIHTITMKSDSKIAVNEIYELIYQHVKNYGKVDSCNRDFHISPTVLMEIKYG